MAYPISPRAIDYVRKQATSVMQYTCRIERVTPPSHDEITLVASPGGRTTIYTGICRLWEVTGATEVVLADDDVIVQNTNLSIPWDVEVLPRRNDEVQILTAPTDGFMVGKRFRITSSAKAGEMRATRRFTVTTLERVP